MAQALKRDDDVADIMAGVEAQQYPLLFQFVSNSPYKPYCTDEKGTPLIIRQRRYAFMKRYIQHNPPDMCHWLTFDLDHGNPYVFKDHPLPTPNLIAMTRKTGRSHISYAIESVCTSDAARLKPVQYLSAIQDTYTQLLDADPGYTNFLTKNPLHDDWDVAVFHDHEYSLGELADYTDLTRLPYWTRKRAANDEHQGYGRHVAIFHRLRFWAYDYITFHRDQGTTYERWMVIVLERCEALNTFTDLLPYSSIKSTAKSVGKWVWMNYWPKGKPIRRGMMAETFAQSQLPLDLKGKQRLSSRRTAEIKRKNTEEKIIDAIGVLTGQGKKVTKAAVGRMAGIDRAKLYRDYKHLFVENV